MDPSDGKRGAEKRTVQVKIGSHTQSLTPNEAADYLQKVAAQGWVKSGGTRSKVSINVMNGTSAQMPPAGRSVPDSSSLPPAAQRLLDPLCTEKEMKALMGMFVEIMGLQLNSDRTESTKFPSTTRQQWPDDLWWSSETANVPPLSSKKPVASDDESVDSQLPTLEDIPDRVSAAAACVPVGGLLHACSNLTINSTEANANDPEDSFVTGSKGIAHLEWEALERVAVEDALEHEERSRKPSKTRKKDNSSGIAAETKPEDQASAAAAAHEAALQKAQTLFQARQKAIHAWRKHVMAAFQGDFASTQCRDLADALATSPALDDSHHVSPLLPLLLAKNRSLGGRHARAMLAAFILNMSVELTCLPLARDGRSVLHSACWTGDVLLVRQILDAWKRSSGKKRKKEKPLVKSLDETCHDSGLTAVQYAALSGSPVVMEWLLRYGCGANIPSDETRTWLKASGKGATALEIVKAVRNGKLNKVVESNGMAVPQLEKDFLENKVEQERYMLLMELVEKRLLECEKGYESKPIEQVQREVDAIDVKVAHDKQVKEEEALEKQKKVTAEEPALAPKKRNRKKKKKSSANVEQSSDQSLPSTKNEHQSASTVEDPLVVALLGMGFSKEQIDAGIYSCGGNDRATADDVVAWIVGQGDNGESSAVSQEEASNEDNDQEGWSNVDTARKKQASATSKTGDEKISDPDRLAAAKREEQRRRNREWNNRTRQRQEAKLPVVKEANSTLVPSLSVDADGEKHAIPSRFGPSTQQKQPPAFQPATNTPAVETADTWDAGSILEHGSIEINVQDDATISTIGSFQTRATSVGPAPTAPLSGPPGLDPSSQFWGVPSQQPELRSLHYNGNLMAPGIPEANILQGGLLSRGYAEPHGDGLHGLPPTREGALPPATLTPPTSVNESGFLLPGHSVESHGPTLGGLFPTPNQQNVGPPSLQPSGTLASVHGQSSQLDPGILESLSAGLGGTTLWDEPPSTNKSLVGGLFSDDRKRGTHELWSNSGDAPQGNSIW